MAADLTMTNNTIPDVLRALVPSIGSIWHWEPMQSTASQRIKVVSVEWNGEEVVIGTVKADRLGWFTDVTYNDFGRFIEAAVCVEVPE